MNCRRILNIACIILFLGVHQADAQPIRLLQSASDTVDTIQHRMGEILSKPFSPDKNTLIDQISTIQAYHTWAQQSNISLLMPLSKRLDVFEKKAQSDFLLGMYQAFLIRDYAKMGSGVMPLSQRVHGLLDSSLVNYQRLLKYVVDQTKHGHRLDAAVAENVSDGVKEALLAIRATGHMEPLQQFDVDSTVYATYQRFRQQEVPIKHSLSWWFAQPFTDSTATKKETHPQTDTSRVDHQ